MCGEHKPALPVEVPSSGSSPRVRGTRFQEHRAFVVGGIIPACAGNTEEGHRASMVSRDHPRMCGEHKAAAFQDFMASGSSPRVRGTQRLRPDGPAARGIIPACAGNTLKQRPRCSTTWDHPRVCGEHLFCDRMDELPRVSSPRVRGTQQCRIDGIRQSGIIPACAGNTLD